MAWRGDLCPSLLHSLLSSYYPSYFPLLPTPVFHCFLSSSSSPSLPPSSSLHLVFPFPHSLLPHFFSPPALAFSFSSLLFLTFFLPLSSLPSSPLSSSLPSSTFFPPYFSSSPLSLSSFPTCVFFALSPYLFASFSFSPLSSLLPSCSYFPSFLSCHPSCISCVSPSFNKQLETLSSLLVHLLLSFRLFSFLSVSVSLVSLNYSSTSTWLTLIKLLLQKHCFSPVQFQFFSSSSFFSQYLPSKSSSSSSSCLSAAETLYPPFKIQSTHTGVSLHLM